MRIVMMVWTMLVLCVEEEEEEGEGKGEKLVSYCL